MRTFEVELSYRVTVTISEAALEECLSESWQSTIYTMPQDDIIAMVADCHGVREWALSQIDGFARWNRRDVSAVNHGCVLEDIQEKT